MADPTLFAAVVALAAVVIIANLAERRTELRPTLSSILLIFNFLYLMLFGFSARNATLGTILLAFAFAGMATLLLLRPVRQRLAVFFPQRIAGQGFDPASPLQMTALVYCVYLIGNTVMSFALAGGFSGLSDPSRFDAGEATAPASLLANMFLLSTFGFVGAGLGTRRALSDVLARLGLRAPTLRELFVGVSVAFWLFWLAFFIGTIWQMLVPPDVLEEQTQLSGLIASSITTMMGAFLLAGTAAVGEEIAFRGALQPIFGIWPTSVIFTLTHIQYTLTPAAFLILFVSFGFGWVRRRHNTTAAIVAHFLYNFSLMALAVYSRYVFSVVESLR